MSDSSPRSVALVVDDDPAATALVAEALAREGITAVAAASADEARAVLADRNVDLIVLDLGLPDDNGLHLLSAVREAAATPVIIVSGHGELEDRVVGLRLGADDYLVKPFSLDELHARIRAVARRREEHRPRLAAGDVVLDLAQRRVWVDDEELRLRAKEFDVLAMLLAAAGEVVTRRRLHDEVWDGADEHLRGNSLEVALSRLRHHLARSRAVRITTLRGIGYRLDVEG